MPIGEPIETLPIPSVLAARNLFVCVGVSFNALASALAVFAWRVNEFVCVVVFECAIDTLANALVVFAWRVDDEFVCVVFVDGAVTIDILANALAVFALHVELA